MINHTSLETHFLNSSNLLNYLEGVALRDTIDESMVKHSVFLSYHESNKYQPDHFLHSQWEGLKARANKKGLSIGPMLALDKIVQEHFCHEKTGVKVELHKFNHWQNIMARVSCLPLHAWYVSSRTAYNNLYNWPLYPYHPYVEDYLATYGLHETHQHLNGSTSAEECWLDALKKPHLACHKFSKEYAESSDLRQLCSQIDPSLTPTKLIERLHVARTIREVLALVALGQKVPNKITKARTINDLKTIKSPLLVWPTPKPYEQHAEHKMLTGFLTYCKERKSVYERLLWVYLLIQNQYLSLLVQRDDFYGFDQFQKYTFTELRDLTERSYSSRFKQVHGTGLISQVESFEGRFAPKKTSMQMETLLTTILGGYLDYLKPRPRSGFSLSSLLNELSELDEKNTGRGKAKLALVVHFIKRQANERERYPYEGLYNLLIRQTSIILGLIRKEPRLREWLRGIDAAANEMHTPPEVFAPVFRVLKQYGIEHITYHVGEDFPHLVSGIRSISEAIDFLPLRSGDRLGHCTAIGIDPDVWKRTLPLTLHLSQETLMLDSLFIWRELRSSSEMSQIASEAASKAIKLASNIFDFDHDVSIETVDEIMSLREALPTCRSMLGEDTALPPYFLQEEFLYSEKLFNNGTRKLVIDLYKKWLTDKDVLAKRNTLVCVERDYISKQTLLALQQRIMKKICTMSIAVECPPTSNTRISQYNDISEHHIFRWMGLDGAMIEGDTLMSICLGSDDPGIFVTDLKSEFYHLFSILVSKFGVSPEKAVTMVSKVNENGKVFRFHRR